MKKNNKNREGVMKSLVSYAPAKLQTKDSGGFSLYDPNNNNNLIRFRNTSNLYYKAQMNGHFYDNFGNQ